MNTKYDSSFLFKISLIFKGSVLGLRPFLTTESPLKMMKNVFYFILKVLFAPEIFIFLS